MREHLNQIIEEIEILSPEGIITCFENGISPNDLFNGEPLINELIGGYARNNRFAKCVQAFVSYGLVFDDKTLLNVLLNADVALEQLIKDDPSIVNSKFTIRSSYTPLTEVSLMHICAEFNHTACAEVLFKYGAEINAKAGLDKYGFGGHTPIFHTVNQNSNNSFDMLLFLLSKSPDLKTTITGLIWGKGYDWETFIPAVNPISYAMMGLLPQMHRDPITVSTIVSLLLRNAYDIDYKPQNVPCAYLKK